MADIYVMICDVRSCYNVGSIFRTCEGLGVKKIFLTGLTPYPKAKNDARLPHIAARADSQIAKTALGAERIVDFEYQESTLSVIKELKERKIKLVAIEQTPDAKPVPELKPEKSICFLFGSERSGLHNEILESVDETREILMVGTKESFNVSVTAGMVLFDYIQKI